MTAGAGVELSSSAAGTAAAATEDEGFRVLSCTTGAKESLLTLTLLVGLALAGAPLADRADRADDAVLLAAEELAVELCPELSGAALATAAPAPPAISNPAPTANPKVVIRPARLMDVMLAPARITVNENCRDL